MASTKNTCKLVNELKSDTSGKIEELEEEIADLATALDTKASIVDSDTALDSTWSSSKIKTEIDAGGGSSLNQLTLWQNNFMHYQLLIWKKSILLRDFPDITISPGHMYLVNWGVYKRDTGVVANMNANFKLEILSNNSVQRTIEVNQPNGSGQQIFGTSIQPFTLLVSKDATNIGFKLYGNNSSGEKSYTFDFVIQIYDLGEVK